MGIKYVLTLLCDEIMLKLNGPLQYYIFEATLGCTFLNFSSIFGSSEPSGSEKKITFVFEKNPQEKQ